MLLQHTIYLMFITWISNVITLNEIISVSILIYKKCNSSLIIDRPKSVEDNILLDTINQT